MERVGQEQVVSFFFQAEDGIRDLTVTGVQTCALPISERWPSTVFGAMPSRDAISLEVSPSASSRRSEEHTSELQSQSNLVCRLLLEKKKRTVLRTTRRSISVGTPSTAMKSIATSHCVT